MERKEVFLTDMYEAFEPKEVMSLEFDSSKLNIIPYENEDYSGRYITSTLSNNYPSIYCDPKLSGWYKIYLGHPGKVRYMSVIKLTKDSHSSYIEGIDSNYAEEMFWRCADMTDQKIEMYSYTTLASIRFVPMSDDEVEAHKADLAQRETKKFYVADDMFHSFTWTKNVDLWVTNVDKYRESDAEWFAPECWYAPADDEFYYNVRKAMVIKAHELGMKVAHSSRMAHWGGGYPYHYKGLGKEFSDEHLELRCHDRNGELTYGMSYAYPEVRRHMIDVLLNAVRCGGEAVSLLVNRGTPYVLFEKPVVDRFFERYGEYPYDRRLDDPELNDIHCEFIEEFFQELRDTLDKEFGKDKIEIHIRGFNSINDCKYVGVDVERLVKKGLLNAIATHPRRFIEILPNEVMRADAPNRIDMDKYNEYIKHNETSTMHYGEGDMYEQFPTCNSELVGPASIKENAMQWVEFSNKYNIPVYFDYTFCGNSNEELMKGVSELYDLGIENLTVFNTVLAYRPTPIWNLVRNICHKEDMKNPDYLKDKYIKRRVISINGVNYKRYHFHMNG